MFRLGFLGIWFYEPLPGIVWRAVASCLFALQLYYVDSCICYLSLLSSICSMFKVHLIYRTLAGLVMKSASHLLGYERHFYTFFCVDNQGKLAHWLEYISLSLINRVLNAGKAVSSVSPSGLRN